MQHPTPLISLPLSLSAGWILGDLVFSIFDTSYKIYPEKQIVPFLLIAFATFVYMSNKD